MRQIGKIKWFGGENYHGEKQRYGFISRHQAPDLYVHKNQLLCSENQLRENVVVTFEIGLHKNKEQAQKVTLINLEEDMDTLKELSINTEKWIWTSALPHYIDKLETHEIYPFILKKLKALSEPKERDLVLGIMNEEQFLANYEPFVEYAGPDQIKKLCIRLYQSNESAVSPELKNRLISAIKQTGLKEWESLPLQVYRQNSDILMALSRDKEQYIKCLVKLIEVYPEHQAGLLHQVHLTIKNASFFADLLWSSIPEHLVKMEPLWSNAPRNIKFPLMDLGTYSKEGEAQLKKWLNEENSFSSKRQFVESLPAHYQKLRPFISYLPPKTQVDLLWEEFLVAPERVWGTFTKISKVLALYRIAKEDLRIERDVIINIGDIEKELQIKALLLLLWGKAESVERKISVFKKAHDYIQDDIINQAMNSTGPVSTLRLLPGCYVGLVSYCEGKPWFTETEIKEGKRRTERAYCPRKRGSCEVASCNTGNQKGHLYVWNRINGYGERIKGDSSVERGDWAQIYSDPDFDWENWSLHEFLKYCEIKPVIAGLEDSGDYVNKLAGWINRINEIRERLKCSKCKQLMENNFEYSKVFTAVYRTTIASCREGFPHDQNVYLSHCWGCEAIIDSRESPIRVGHFYLCHKCGSGPQGIDYKPGDICPKCGMSPMKNEGYRTYKCGECNHTIKTSHRSS